MQLQKYWAMNQEKKPQISVIQHVKKKLFLPGFPVYN